MAVKLLVDSASDITKEEANKLGIELISMTIRIDEKDYLDGMDLTPHDFFEKVSKTKDFPKTSQINEYDFEDRFSELTKEDDEVICITMSSKLSGTYNNAVSASQKFDGKVVVVDSYNVGIGERLLVQYALRLIKKGLSAKEVAEKCDKEKNRIVFVAMINTLEFLHKGGRLSKVNAILGSILSLKPLIAIADGVVKFVGKAMGTKKAFKQLTQMVQGKQGIDYSMPYGLTYSGTDSSVLDTYIEDAKHIWQEHTTNMPIYALGGTIGAHIGPKGVGVAFFELEK